MDRDSLIALIIASIITIIAATPLYYSRDYPLGSNGKNVEGSDTKMSEPMMRKERNSEANIPNTVGNE